MKWIATIALAAGALASSLSAVLADDYPSRTVRVVVPYAAGGPSDTGARLAAEPLSQVLGKPVVIENRGGGGGLNATEAYFKAEADGYTILMGGIGPLTIIPAFKPVSYDVEKDVVPLSTVWRSAQVLAVRPSLGIKTVAEFVAYAKANPNKLTIGSAGVGAVTHLAIEVLKREAKIEVLHIPFRSTSESMPQLIGGQIDALFGDGPTIAPQVNSGHIVALAVAGPHRGRALPDVPTMAEAGFPTVESESWFSFVVSSKTPKPIIERLQSAMVTAQKDPDYQAKLAKQGASAGEPGPEALAKLIKNDTAKWGAIIKAAGIKPE
ncbi:Bug family tripartite tricarboxylate transporter substrate binding protein [Rhodoplanes sp. Z2-YC6860]|uniref:Bug family tripartite tricarboxylate transporter substrate binding protein n=1 Tax=Rhodoplanes sp. Z2-YC6860 TaxID=674703 RepID=UPI00078DBA6D|nr:tripartite tricarboxylate transporter substrate binding protein [Rhodoplanes sp. Z2-YC6860]AMN42083.1 Tripartite tricarboxylate transporter TctC family [Rhodoplanes sp. Z2-YC6860]